MKKLVAEVLDRIDQYPDFDPRKDYAITISANELTRDEKRVLSADDIELEL